MELRATGLVCAFITFALVTRMSASARDNKRRGKDKTGGFQKNICDITDRESKVHCYCENTREPRNATKAECWVFNGGIPNEDPIWQSFASQPTLQTLSFNVRVDGALSYVPTKALYYLQRLLSINIKYGNIAEVSSFAMANLTSLREATLSQNQIETLKPYSFAHLPNITVINLEDNMIGEIGNDVFYAVPKLQRLVLTKNNITSIKDAAFQHAFNLLELDLNKNSIHQLNRHTFDGLANLGRLDLRRNRLYNLTEFTFAELWNLQELLLGKNELKFVSERAFDGLSQLKKLSLDDNKLAVLPSGLFEGVRGLSSLDLRANELYSLTFNNIKPILDNLKPQNSNLLLEDNNFICDCRLKWMHTLRNETRSQSTKLSLGNVTCKADSPITSSAYNKITDKNSETSREASIDKPNGNSNIDESIANDISEGVARKNLLKIPPEILPCPQRMETTTEAQPFVVDPVVPVQNEMKTFQLQENSSRHVTPCVYVLWLVFVLFFFT